MIRQYEHAGTAVVVSHSARTRACATVALCVIALLISACTESTEPQVPVPGTLTVSWVTPHEAEGAVRLTLKGPEVSAISAAQPGDLVFSRSSGTSHSIVVLGTIGSGGLIRVEVPDVQQVQRYQATIVEVAAADSNQLRGDLSAYELVIRR